MPTERLELIIDALNYANAELEELKKDLHGVDQAAQQTSKGGLASLKAGWIAASAAAVAFGVAVKKGYDFLKEGAQLELEAYRFDRLALTIGTTGEALRADLIPAMRGMMSEAESVAMAAEMMSLGLAKSHEEAVRLARVAGAMDMDMNQLVLTLTNMTTMRFDALGLSVDGFKEKVNALKATMSEEEAFKMAFLEQAETQIEKVGEAADTNAGKIAAFESAWANMVDKLKVKAVDVGMPAIDASVQMMMAMEATKRAADLGLITDWQEMDMIMQALTSSSYSYYDVLQEINPMLAEYDNKMDMVASATNYADAAMLQYANATQMTAGDVAGADAVLGNYVLQTLEVVAATEQVPASLQAVTQEIDLLADAASRDMMIDVQIRKIAGATGDLSGSFADTTSMATNFLAEMDFIEAGGTELEAVLQDIAGLKVSPEVKRDLLEKAAVAAVELDVSLGKISRWEGAGILKEALDLTSLQEGITLISGPEGIYDNLEELDGMVAEAKIQVKDEATAELERIQGLLDDLIGNYVIGITVRTSGEMGGRTVTVEGGGEDVPLASAMYRPVAFEVPGGFPNDSFRMSVQTGEKVAVWNASKPDPFNVDVSPLAMEITGLRRDMATMPKDIARAVRDAMAMVV